MWPPGSADTVCPRRPLMIGTALGQDSSDWSRDLETLTFALGGHGACGWCGSSSFIRVPSLKFVGLPCRSEDMAHNVLPCHVAMCGPLMGLVTLTIDLLTLKLVCESHQRWGNFVQNIGTLSLRVLQLFAMYARQTDGRTDGRTKANTVPFLRAGA